MRFYIIWYRHSSAPARGHGLYWSAATLAEFINIYYGFMKVIAHSQRASAHQKLGNLISICFLDKVLLWFAYYDVSEPISFCNLIKVNGYGGNISVFSRNMSVFLGIDIVAGIYFC